jgi:hypothetical protein
LHDGAEELARDRRQGGFDVVGGRQLVDGGPEDLVDADQAVEDDLLEEVLFAAEVLVDRLLGRPGRGGDLVGLGAQVAVSQEHLRRGVDDAALGLRGDVLTGVRGWRIGLAHFRSSLLRRQ